MGYNRTTMLMCIAIMNAGKMLPKKKLKNCWNYNDDGAGILYINDGVLCIEKFPNKGGDSFNTFLERYVSLKTSDVGNKPMLLHFRIATHGMSDEYLHPFPVTDTLGLVHNGVISGFGTKDKSDTAEFAELLSTIPNMSMEMLDNPFIEDAIYTYLGGTNKVVFLDNTGEWCIFGEKLGEWIGDNWFSNDSHSKAVRYYGSTAVTGSSNYVYDWDDDQADVDAWNESFGITTTDELDEIAYELEAPLHGAYDCKACGAEHPPINFNSECMECGAYNLEAVDEVIELWSSLECGYEGDELKDVS